MYDSELMTGFLEPKGIPMPISAMTVEALADLGYEVDMSKADAYTVDYSFPPSTSPTTKPPTRRKRDLQEYELKENAIVAESRRLLDEQIASGEKIPMGNDIANVPIIMLSDLEGVQINPKSGRDQDFHKEKEAFKHRNRNNNNNNHTNNNKDKTS